jgi:pyruvate,orthophosphate dikinase
MLDLVDGIGLVRTEQMVATGYSQMTSLKQILLTEDAGGYTNLFDWAGQDYRRIFAKLDQDQPVKIRLFDFVHREILNKQEQEQFIAKYGKLDIHGGQALEAWPQLYQRQVRTIFRALKDADTVGTTPLEIMMPAVRTEQDVLAIKKIVSEEAGRLRVKPEQYRFGVMIETLESCENISAIAKHCDFISFGTNDLTQQFFDISRSDLKAHARFAEKNGYDPFRKLSPQIFDLMHATVADARAANPALKIDVCGAQAADPDTAVALFNIGVDNVSVAPNLANLFGLPVLLNYMAYDALQKPGTASAPAGAKKVVP